MTKLFEVEQVINRSDVDTEDSGCAKIVDVAPDDDQEDGMFVRIQSWSDSTDHPDFDKMIGKRIRVTIEILD